MSDHDQTPVPPSFVALFVLPGRSKPNASRADIAARYDLCEDLATLLMEPAQTQLWAQHLTQAQVLLRMHLGLCGHAADAGDAPADGPDRTATTDASSLTRAEAQWVTTRLAELLGWRCPPWSAQDV